MKTFLKTIAIILLVVAVVAAVFGLSFLIIAGIYKLVCMAFGFEFTWLKALAVWLVWGLICGLAKIHVEVES